jgi:hypothetical protein
MKIMWWNVQRLGSTTDPNVIKQIETTENSVDPDVSIYCELTTSDASAFSTIKPYNFTYRKKNTKQLCYGIGRGNYVPEEVEPKSTKAYQMAVFKGGNDFSQLVDRKLARITLDDGVAVYFMHAPGSESSGGRATCFVACWLKETYPDTPWILVGDLNAPPEKVAGWVPDLNEFIYATGSRTHRGFKELDWAMANGFDNHELTIGIRRRSPRWSDHWVIVIEYKSADDKHSQAHHLADTNMTT